MLLIFDVDIIGINKLISLYRIKLIPICLRLLLALVVFVNKVGNHCLSRDSESFHYTLTCIYIFPACLLSPHILLWELWLPTTHNAVYLTGMLFVATLSLYHACNIHYLVDRKHSIGDSMCSFMRITILCYACLLLTCLLNIIIPKLLILFYLLTQVWNKHFRKMPSFLLFLVFYMWQYVNTRVILVRTSQSFWTI